MLLILRLSRLVLDFITSRFRGDAKSGVDFVALTGDAGLPGFVLIRTGGAYGACDILPELLSIGAAPGLSNCV